METSDPNSEFVQRRRMELQSFFKDLFFDNFLLFENGFVIDFLELWKLDQVSTSLPTPSSSDATSEEKGQGRRNKNSTSSSSSSSSSPQFSLAPKASSEQLHQTLLPTANMDELDTFSSFNHSYDSMLQEQEQKRNQSFFGTSSHFPPLPPHQNQDGQGNPYITTPDIDPTDEKFASLFMKDFYDMEQGVDQSGSGIVDF